MENVTLFRVIMEKWKKDRNVMLLAGILLLALIGCVVCGILYKATGSYVTPEGQVVESFGYVILAFLFGFVALLSGICLSIVAVVRHMRRRQGA
jgi:RsiW-degrading membrane proteinase PrsW (M82 family)